jgi:hypothetical protein
MNLIGRKLKKNNKPKKPNKTQKTHPGWVKKNTGFLPTLP